MTHIHRERKRESQIDMHRERVKSGVALVSILGVGGRQVIS